MGQSVIRSTARGRATALTVVALVLWAPCAAAQQVFALPSGQDVSLGGASHPRTVQIAANNPAAPVSSDRKGFWFGLGAVGVGYEIADFNNLLDRFEKLEEDLDRENIAQAEAEAIEADAEAFLAELSNSAYIKLFAAAQPPFLPMGGSLPLLNGAMTFSLRAIGGARISFLGSDVEAVNSGTVTPCSSANCEITSDIAGYGKAAAGGVASVGYSGGVLHRHDGSLFAGGRLNYYTLELSRAVVKLEDGGDNAGDDAEDGLGDEFDRNRVRSSDIGLDLGLMWAAHNFRAGATVRNVNEPEFEYASFRTSCTGLAAGTAQRRNCEAALAFSAADPSRVPLTEVYEMERQLQFEAAAYTANRTWSLAATYDADGARDATGDVYQWLGVSAAFAPGNFGGFVPGVRIGYRQNQVGSELDMVSLGLTLFRVINLDVAASTQSVEDEGDEAPRSLMTSLSLELFF